MGSHGGYIPTYTPSHMDNSERLELIDIEHDWNRSIKHDNKMPFLPGGAKVKCGVSWFVEFIAVGFDGDFVGFFWNGFEWVLRERLK